MTDKKKTVEDYERLAARLALDRDSARDVASRLAREKKVLEQELIPLLERVSAQLGGAAQETTYSPGELRTIREHANEIHALQQKAMWYDAIVAIVDSDGVMPSGLAELGEPAPAIAFVLALVTKYKFDEHLEANPTPPPVTRLRLKAKAKPKKKRAGR